MVTEGNQLMASLNYIRRMEEQHKEEAKRNDDFRADFIKNLATLVESGESTGDRITDFFLKQGIISEEAINPLRELEAKLKKGQLFLVRQQIAETRSDYYTNWYVGVLSGETLVFFDERFGIPTEKYLAHGPGMRKMVTTEGSFMFPCAKGARSALGAFGCIRTKPEFEVTIGDLEVLALALDVLGNAALYQMAKALRKGARG